MINKTKIKQDSKTSWIKSICKRHWKSSSHSV